MNNWLVFGLGALLGTVVSTIVLDRYYNKLMDEQDKYYEEQLEVVKKNLAEDIGDWLEKNGDSSLEELEKALKESEGKGLYTDIVFRKIYDDIDDMKTRRDRDLEQTIRDTTYIKPSPDLSRYTSLVNDYVTTEHPEDDKEEIADGIYEILPDEYVLDKTYEKRTITLFADGVLVDELTDEVLKFDSTISYAGPDCIGHWEEDIAYIRNVKFGVDYEVVRDLRRYADIVSVEEGEVFS